MLHERSVFWLAAGLLAASASVGTGTSPQKEQEAWPRRVLITNDDGIDDPKIKALAAAFARKAETVVVAPLGDRSGTTHMASAFQKHALQVERRKLGEGIRAFGVDGYPADCVLLALRGLMRETPPDLVVSGINDGPNLGFDWVASGTIGAARIAAYWGVPAIAVSGMKTEIPGSLEAVADWVVQFAGSGSVKGLRTGQYLTLSFPRIPPSDIKGIRVAERAGILLDFVFKRAAEAQEQHAAETWRLQLPARIEGAPGTDAALYSAGYIVAVPMRADEMDPDLLRKLRAEPHRMPRWPLSKDGGQAPARQDR